MQNYIVRQPVLNRRHEIEAYEIIYQSDRNSLGYGQSDSRVAEAIIAFFTQLDEADFLDNKDAYLCFTPNLLLENVPNLFDEKKLIIQFDESVLICEEPRKLLKRYKDSGYRLALSSFDFNRRYLDFVSMVDVMKLDFADPTDRHLQSLVEFSHQYGLRICAYHVDTPEAMKKAEEMGVDLFQGNYVSQASTSKVHITEHLRSNFFRLMAAIYCDAPDFDEIAEIISLDVTLTFSLLRIVNSAYFALPNRVSSVQQALMILGLNQLRNWIYLISFSSEDDTPSELIRTSFLRGTFCQRLAGLATTLPVSSSEAYMMGIFSTLDSLLDVPMADAVKDLPIQNAIKDALVGREGICSELLQLCIAYEKGKWNQVAYKAEKLGLAEANIGPEYIRSVQMVNKTWDALTNMKVK